MTNMDMRSTCLHSQQMLKVFRDGTINKRRCTNHTAYYARTLTTSTRMEKPCSEYAGCLCPPHSTDGHASPRVRTEGGRPGPFYGNYEVLAVSIFSLPVDSPQTAVVGKSGKTEVVLGTDRCGIVDYKGIWNLLFISSRVAVGALFFPVLPL